MLHPRSSERHLCIVGVRASRKTSITVEILNAALAKLLSYLVQAQKLNWCAKSDPDRHTQDATTVS